MKHEDGDTTKVAERHKREMELYLHGKTLQAIAEIVGVTRATVCRDISKMRLAWKAAAIVDFEEKLDLEIAKIDVIEMTAWEGWDRSCQPSEERDVREKKQLTQPSSPRNVPPVEGRPTPRRKVGQPTLVTKEIVSNTTTKFRDGNPAFLDRIAWCIEMRLRLIGALKGDKATVQVININWDSLSSFDDTDLIEAKIKAIQDKSQVNGQNGHVNGSTQDPPPHEG